LILDWLGDPAAPNRRGLMLIIDHCPHPATIAAFENSLGVTWNDDSVRNELPGSQFSGLFCRGTSCGSSSDGVVLHTEITQGRRCGERVERAGYYTGSTLEMVPAGSGVLQFNCSNDDRCNSVLGNKAGAAFQYGAGRVYLATEASMFTATCHPELPTGGCDVADMFGLQPEIGNHNEQLLLNIVHWLDRWYPEACSEATDCPANCALVAESCHNTDLCAASCVQLNQSMTSCVSSGNTLHLRNCDCDCGGAGMLVDYYQTLVCL
jgi:hypothetical protein